MLRGEVLGLLGQPLGRLEVGRHGGEHPGPPAGAAQGQTASRGPRRGRRQAGPPAPSGVPARARDPASASGRRRSPASSPRRRRSAPRRHRPPGRRWRPCRGRTPPGPPPPRRGGSRSACSSPRPTSSTSWTSRRPGSPSPGRGRDGDRDHLAARALGPARPEHPRQVDAERLAGLLGTGTEHRPVVADGERERQQLDPGELVWRQAAQREGRRGDLGGKDGGRDGHVSRRPP